MERVGVKSVLNPPSPLDWIVFGIVFAIGFFLFSQGKDLIVTGRFSNLFMDSLFQGRILQFYDIGFANPVIFPDGDFYYPNYNIALYFILGVCYLPLKLVGYFFDGNLPDLAYVLYGKFIIAIWIAVAAALLYKLAYLIGATTGMAKWSVYLFLSSPFLLFGGVLFGQYDILTVVFTLAALFYYCKGEYWKFSLLMIPAISGKFFAMFLMIPLILLVEKRIYKICAYLLCGISGLLLMNLMYRNSEGYQAIKVWEEDSWYFLGKFFRERFFDQRVSLFLLCFLLVCIACYWKKVDRSRIFLYITTIPILVFSSFFLFYPTHPQWYVIFTPYMALFLLQLENRKAGLLLESLFGLAYLLVSLRFRRNVDNYQINYGILPSIFSRKYSGQPLSDFFTDIFVPERLEYNITVIARTVEVACLITLIALAVRQFLQGNKENHTENESHTENLNSIEGVQKETYKEFLQVPLEVERGLVWLRPLIVFAVFILPSLILYFL